MIHLDIDHAEINKNVIVDCSVLGDAKEVLKNLDVLKIPYLRTDENGSISYSKITF